MTLVLVLALVGSVLAGEAQTGNPFETAPLRFSRPVLRGPFRLATEARLQVGADQGPLGAAQGPNASPRVVCTMRIIKAGPSLDPRFVVSVPPGPPDPIVRDDLSPCIE